MLTPAHPAPQVRNNLHVALAYMESWLRGVGCVPIHNLMEDAATAEISRTQVRGRARQWCQAACLEY